MKISKNIFQRNQNPVHKHSNSQSLRIVQVAAPWLAVPPKNYGGTELVISNLTEELVKRGHQVTLFASGDSETSAKLKSYIAPSLTEQGVSWNDYIEAEYHLIRSFHEIKHHAADYDLVHVHLSSAADLILLKLVTQIDVPCICTLHSRFPFDRRKNYVGEGDRYYFSWGANIPMIAISHRAKEDALKTSTFPLNFVGVIPHGLTDDCFHKSEATADSPLVWIGKIVPDKGTKYAIEAAVKAKRKIIIAGIVDEHLAESVDYFRQEVEPLIKANPEYVEFRGPVGHRDKIKLLRSSYCFLNPIQWEEPFGLVMIEAMACGCPVISFEQGAAKELIKPGKNGAFAATVDDMTRLIDGIDQQIDRDQMVLDTWNHYSVTKMAEQYESAYRERLKAATRLQNPAAF